MSGGAQSVGRSTGCRAVALALLVACAPITESPPLSEPARWLQQYLRFDTSNPPGNERAAVDYLAAILRAEEIEVEVLTTPAGRSSLWAAVGPRDADALLLLSHVDVVAAEEGWSVPPFAGLVLDGEIWGRGAIDAKGLGVTHVAALVALARAPEPSQRRVALFAAADEELGGAEGTAWWLEHRPDLFATVRGVLAEGGNNRVGMSPGQIAWWGIEVAQKRPLWLETCGTTRAELVRGLARAMQRPLVWRVDEPAREFFRRLRALGPRGGTFDPDRDVAPTGPLVWMPPGLQNYFLDSLQINQFLERAGVSCATIDIRLLPSTDDEAFLAGVRERLGPTLPVKVLLTGPDAPPSSPDDPLYQLLAHELAPEAPVAPIFIAGITDARHFRARGIAVYGFSPFLLDGEHSRAIHAADERLPVIELDAGVERMARAIGRWSS